MEWKPVFTKFDTSRAAVLQIASEQKCYVVDMIELGDSQELNDALTSLFLNK